MPDPPIAVNATRRRQAADHLDDRQEDGQDDEEHDPAQEHDHQRLNQVPEVRDHDRDLLVVVVGQVGEALRQLAGLFSRGDDGDHVGSELPRVVEDSAQLLAGDDLGAGRSDRLADRGSSSTRRRSCRSSCRRRLRH